MSINNTKSINVFKGGLDSSDFKEMCRKSKSFVLKKENQKKIAKVVGVVSLGVIAGVFTFKVLIPYIHIVKKNIRIMKELKII